MDRKWGPCYLSWCTRPFTVSFHATPSIRMLSHYCHIAMWKPFTIPWPGPFWSPSVPAAAFLLLGMPSFLSPPQIFPFSLQRYTSNATSSVEFDLTFFTPFTSSTVPCSLPPLLSFVLHCRMYLIVLQLFVSTLIYPCRLWDPPAPE